MGHSETTHPVDEALAPFTDGHAESRGPLASFDRPVGSEWHRAVDLLGDERVLVQTLTRYGENTGTNSPFLQAALFIQEYLVRIVEPAVYGLYTGQRILDVSAGNFAIRLDDSGRISGQSFMSRRFAGLSSDSAAGHPDAVVVPDRDSLIDWMFARMADEHLRPLSQRVRTVSRLRQNVMWADVAGRCVEALINLQRTGRLTMEGGNRRENCTVGTRSPSPA